MTGAKIAVEERLFSLILALLATEVGLTKHEILSTVQGYQQQFSRRGDNDNLERQFERDKDNIRELGVPLEAIEDPSDAGNNQKARYRIPRGAYELPRELSFTAEEQSLLQLAAVVWREGSLSKEAKRAMLKLRSLGLTTSEPPLLYAPRGRARDAAFEPLESALAKRVAVSFLYIKPGEREASLRTVEPLALFQHEGRWHLYSQLPGTSDTRTYLLSRIVGAVKVSNRSFSPPPGDQAAIGLSELIDVWNARTTTIEVRAGSDAELRLSGRRGTVVDAPGRLTLHFADANIMADTLASFGPEVLVLSPPEMRAAVIERLQAVVATHRAEVQRG